MGVLFLPTTVLILLARPIAVGLCFLRASSTLARIASPILSCHLDGPIRVSLCSCRGTVVEGQGSTRIGSMSMLGEYYQLYIRSSPVAGWREALLPIYPLSFTSSPGCEEASFQFIPFNIRAPSAWTKFRDSMWCTGSRSGSFSSPSTVWPAWPSSSSVTIRE